MGHNILVFEDDPVTGTLMRAVLTNRGYEVDVAKTAEAGLEKAAISPPGLILMDIGLAGEMDGLESATLSESTLAPHTHTVPEPSGGLLVVFGAGLLCVARRRQQVRD